MTARLEVITLLALTLPILIQGCGHRFITCHAEEAPPWPLPKAAVQVPVRAVIHNPDGGSEVLARALRETAVFDEVVVSRRDGDVAPKPGDVAVSADVSGEFELFYQDRRAAHRSLMTVAKQPLLWAFLPCWPIPLFFGSLNVFVFPLDPWYLPDPPMEVTYWLQVGARRFTTVVNLQTECQGLASGKETVTHKAHLDAIRTLAWKLARDDEGSRQMRASTREVADACLEEFRRKYQVQKSREEYAAAISTLTEWLDLVRAVPAQVWSENTHNTTWARDWTARIHYDLARCRALSGDRERALGDLQQALASGWSDFHHLDQDRDIDALRMDSRFQRIVSAASGEAWEPFGAISLAPSRAMDDSWVQVGSGLSAYLQWRDRLEYVGGRVDTGERVTRIFMGRRVEDSGWECSLRNVSVR